MNVLEKILKVLGLGFEAADMFVDDDGIRKVLGRIRSTNEHILSQLAEHGTLDGLLDRPLREIWGSNPDDPTEYELRKAQVKLAEQDNEA